MERRKKKRKEKNLNIYTNIFPTLLFNWKRERADKRVSSRAAIKNKLQAWSAAYPSPRHTAQQNISNQDSLLKRAYKTQ